MNPREFKTILLTCDELVVTIDVGLTRCLRKTRKTTTKMVNLLWDRPRAAQLATGLNVVTALPNRSELNWIHVRWATQYR